MPVEMNPIFFSGRNQLVWIILNLLLIKKKMWNCHEKSFINSESIFRLALLPERKFVWEHRTRSQTKIWNDKLISDSIAQRNNSFPTKLCSVIQNKHKVKRFHVENTQPHKTDGFENKKKENLLIYYHQQI